MRSRQQSGRTFEPTFVSVAAAIACAIGAALLAPPAKAAIVTTGQINVDPSGGSVTGSLNVGNTAAGTLRVDGGSSLTADAMSIALNPGSSGQVVVEGAGSTIGVAGVASSLGFRNFNIGSLGTGLLSVIDGGRFSYGTASSTDCLIGCRVRVGNGAGSSGTLIVRGANSLLTTPGHLMVGTAAVLSAAGGDVVDYGVPGANGSGTVVVEQGGRIQSSIGRIALTANGAGRLGTEFVSGAVTVDGAGSRWDIARNNQQAGTQTLLVLAEGPRVNASLAVRNGGVVAIDGSSAPAELMAVSVGHTASGGDATNNTSSLTVEGTGSRLEMGGGVGVINVGRGNGAVGTLSITSGGQVLGTTDNGLAFATIGRGGGTGVATVDGAGSLLRLAGKASNGDGTFLHVGRFESGAAGTGTLNVSNGGRVEIDTTTTQGLGSNLAGFWLGRGAGSAGTLNLSGAGSVVQVSGNAEMAPYVAVGRDGAVGNLHITQGAQLLLSSQHVSAPSFPLYNNGEALIVDVGRRSSGTDGLASTGTVTVSGSGSAFVASGAADTLLQIGSTVGTVPGSTQGTVTVEAGAVLRGFQTGLLGSGLGAVGLLNVDAATASFTGVRNGGPGAGQGPVVVIGRGNGTGVVNLTHGALLEVVADPGVQGAALQLGGTTNVPGGGTGILNLSGGSTASVRGDRATMVVGRAGAANQPPGLGFVSLAGTGDRVEVLGAGSRVLVGAAALTQGQVTIGQGAVLETDGLVGVAHDGTSDTQGIGTVTVNGTLRADHVTIGTQGTVRGVGLIEADVSNLGGTLAPGLSPGRLTIDGSYDGNGLIELEVQQLAGGGWAYDELVFLQPGRVNLDGAQVRFHFLGNSNPLDFLDEGLFQLGSFFNPAGAGAPALEAQQFTRVTWSATADAYRFDSFSFDAQVGASFTAAPISEPGVAALAALGLLGAALARRRRRGD